VQLYWVSASHTGRYARLTSLGLYVMYAQAVQSVRPVESTGRDRNSYTLGWMGVHNVAVAVMAEIGNNRAAFVATQLLNDFPSI
jgi:hypothetical protein